MADVRAFRGWRYNLAQVGELSEVVAPPYDVIGPAEQELLYRRHPSNVVRLILNREESGDTESENRYTRAARFLRRWKADGTVVEDPDPSLYVVHQQFEAEGQTYNRRGFMARLRLEPFGAGQVYPHEETMPGPKADRLRLFHATAMNLSPIFGLYPDPGNEVQEALEGAIRAGTPIEATDAAAVTSRIWVVNDQELISRVRGLMGPLPIFIADGHHRYETALQYQSERRAAGVGDEDPANAVLMMCVSMSDPGLAILPTHRLVTGLSGLSAAALGEALQPDFELQEVTGEHGCQQAWDLVASEGSQNVLGIGCVAEGRWFTARLRNLRLLQQRVPQRSAAWRNLAVSILHEGVLRSLDDSAKATVKYVHLLEEVGDAVNSGTCDLACLVPPASMDDVRQIATGGERMPPKSTYFYPKLLSGMVFNPIA